MRKFKTGDSVILKSGGPVMVVKNYISNDPTIQKDWFDPTNIIHLDDPDGTAIICDWFENAKKYKNTFLEDQLEFSYHQDKLKTNAESIKYHLEKATENLKYFETILAPKTKLGFNKPVVNETSSGISDTFDLINTHLKSANDANKNILSILL